MNVEAGRLLTYYTSDEGVLYGDVETADGRIYRGVVLAGGQYVEIGMQVFLVDRKVALLPIVVSDRTGAPISGTASLEAGRSKVLVSDAGVEIDSGDFAGITVSWIDDAIRATCRVLKLDTDSFNLDCTYEGEGAPAWRIASSNNLRWNRLEVYDLFLYHSGDAFWIKKTAIAEKEMENLRWARRTVAGWKPQELYAASIYATNNGLDIGELRLQPTYSRIYAAASDGKSAAAVFTPDRFITYSHGSGAVKIKGQAGHLDIYASGDIRITAGGNIYVKAAGNVQIQGATIHLNPPSTVPSADGTVPDGEPQGGGEDAVPQ
ncbi:MAG: hypothetical protein GXO39_04255 [Thermotogae bacterium]|nr:hypothetical protein [Thermotogota bacterium]